LPATKPAGKATQKRAEHRRAAQALAALRAGAGADATACPCARAVCHKIGEDVSEVLDVIPAILRVLRTIRPNMPAALHRLAWWQAKVLPRLIESGMASTALVTTGLSKFAWYAAAVSAGADSGQPGHHLDRATLAAG